MKKNLKNSAKSDNYMSPFPNPTPGQITIAALAPFSDAKLTGGFSQNVSKEDFELIRQCGFNATIFRTGSGNYDYAFSIMEDTGLKAIIYGLVTGDKTNQKRELFCQQVVDNCKNNNILGGWEAMDEPLWDNFNTPYNPNDTEEIKQEKMNLPYFFNYIRSLDNIHPLFVNLAVGTNKNIIGNFSSYWDYLLYVQSTIHPDIWSYDFYPIVQQSTGLYFKKEQFYEWLETFRKISLQTGKPFWAYCMCVEHTSNGNVYPIPTEGELRLEAFNALAYGAQGIVYYKYSSNDDDKEFAPVDKEGELTSIWFTVQKVNKEIEQYNDIFTGCRVINLIHSNGLPVKLSEGPIEEINSSQDIVISRIQSGYKNYYVFVSTNPFGPVQISFKKSANPPGSWKAETDNMTRLHNPLPGQTNGIYNILFDEGGYGIVSW